MEGKVGQSERLSYQLPGESLWSQEGVLAKAPLSPFFLTYRRSDMAHIVPQLLVSMGK